MQLLKEADTLRKVPLFAKLESSRLKLMAFTSQHLTYEDGELVFALRTDEGVFEVATSGGAFDDRAWHAVEIGYDAGRRRLVLEVDGHEVESAASGTTAPGLHWGLALGAAWGDALEGAIDDFEMSAAPDWALG